MSDLLINSVSRARLDTIAPVNDREKIQSGATAFSDVLGNAIDQVNDLQAAAGEEVQRVMTGDMTDIHTAMIAVQKADVSFQMMMQVRNKLVSAYQEIMKLQV
jgi:flagellar hook-basal body complex protein FliE